jgi:dUTP pyrophosphatase
MQTLKFFRLVDDISVPQASTTGSACFDLQAYLRSQSITMYNKWNEKSTFTADQFCVGIRVDPGERVLVPTGLVLDIPQGYSVRIHPRSGLSLKQGLTLVNAEGVIDSDYVEELFIPLYNASGISVQLKHGDRIAQGELVRTELCEIVESTTRPERKTDRAGGFGSTGV